MPRKRTVSTDQVSFLDLVQQRAFENQAVDKIDSVAITTPLEPWTQRQSTLYPWLNPGRSVRIRLSLGEGTWQVLQGVFVEWAEEEIIVEIEGQRMLVKRSQVYGGDEAVKAYMQVGDKWEWIELPGQDYKELGVGPWSLLDAHKRRDIQIEAEIARKSITKRKKR